MNKQKKSSPAKRKVQSPPKKGNLSRKTIKRAVKEVVNSRSNSNKNTKKK